MRTLLTRCSCGVTWSLARALILLAFPPAVVAAQVRTERRTAGDTSILRITGVEPAAAIRTAQQVLSFGRLDGAPEYVFGAISGVRIGAGGSIWVFDRQVPILRQYDSTGRYMKTVGRGGEGPGEYAQGVALAFPRDGRVVLFSNRSASERSAGSNASANQLNVYDASGKYTGGWPVPQARRGPPPTPAMFLTSHSLVTDTAGSIYIAAIVRDLAPVTNTSRPRALDGMIRYRADGTLGDTLVPPYLGLAMSPPSEGGTIYQSREFWSFTNHGNWVGGRSDRYEIHIVQRGGKVIRIERDIPPVQIAEEERRARLDRGATHVPRVKPFFNNLRTDEDGRIWVQLSTPSERGPAATGVANVTTRGGGAAPTGPTFIERPIYEVFTPDGRYLARVRLPEFVYPPAIKGNSIWMQAQDSNGVPIVAKFALGPPLPN